MSTAPAAEFPIRRSEYEDREFSFSDILGQFGGNRGFLEGYGEYQNGQDTQKAYIWHALQAVGDDIGSTVYQNIRHYVELASDIDTCKVAALQSMLRNIGYQIDVMGRAGQVPTEVADMMDLYSVDTRYLLDRGFIGRDAYDRISAAAIENLGVSSIADAGLSSEGARLDDTVFDEGRFQEFLVDQYSDLLSGFITLRYNISCNSRQDGSEVVPYVYMSRQARSNDSEWLSQVRDYMSKNNIDVDFDYDSVVDAIQDGTDQLGNYPQNVAGLLEMVLERRAAPFPESVIPEVYGVKGHSWFQSKYSYYRERKVAEYVDFVQNRFNSRADGQTYDLDPSYTMYDGHASGRSLVKDGYLSGDVWNEIDMDMVRSVARQLARTTVYIRDLRRRMKLQARKCYMKGTNNLILYMVNEYLIDYSRNQLATTPLSGLPPAQLCAFSRLSSHGINDVNVVEYYDATEYYDLSTETTVSAARAQQPVNPRFWADEGAMDQDGMQMRLDQIDRFYLSTMMLKDGLSSDMAHSELTDFLDTVYGFAARKDFLDPSGQFQTELSDGVYSNSIYPVLTTMVEYRDRISSMVSSAMEDSMLPISAQMDELCSYILSTLQDTYLSAISDDYDQNISSVDELQSRLVEISSALGSFLSGDYQLYFDRQDTDVEYDYFNGNPKYESDSLVERIQLLQKYVQDPSLMVNHYAIDSTEDMRSGWVGISSQLDSSVVQRIAQLGYDTQMYPDSLPKKLDHVLGYLDGKIEDRKDYIKQVVESLKSQVKELDSSYQTLNNNFTLAVSRYDSGSPQYKLGDRFYMKFSTTYPQDSELDSSDIAQYKLKPQLNNSADLSGAVAGNMGTITVGQSVRSNKTYVIMPGSGWIFYTSSKGTYYGWCDEIPECNVYKSSSTLEEKCQQIVEWMNLEIFDGFYGLKNDGTLAAVEATRTGLGQLDVKCSDILRQIDAVFGYSVPAQYSFDSISAYVAGVDIQERISRLQMLVNASMDETFIEKDLKLSSYNQYRMDTDRLKASYDSRNDRFQRIFTNSDQQGYMADFTGSNDTADVTMQLMDSLLSYIQTRDSTNQQSAQDDVSRMVVSVDLLQTDAKALESSLAGRYTMTERDPYYIEDYIETMRSDLLGTIDLNRTQGDVSVFTTMSSDVEPALKYLYDNSRTLIDGERSFMEAADLRVSELQYMDEDPYLMNLSIMMNYGGRDISYYPYMNWKNQTHPSYQIHSYLWNLVEKGSQELGSVARRFFSANVANLEWNLVARKADQYYGALGQVVDKWRHPELLDYTGYTSMYESSQHFSTQSRLTSDVVDYGGPFFPPAVEFLLSSDVSRCAESILCAATSKSYYDMLVRDPDIAGADIHDFLVYRQVVVNGFPTMEFANCDPLVSTVSGFMCSTTDITPDGISAIASEYARSNQYQSQTWLGLARQISASAPASFYQRFYSHLGLGTDRHVAERETISRQILAYAGDIREVASPHAPSEVYDIYSYGEDQHGNIYTLYKRYGSESPSFHEKRDTVGRMWIRVQNHPISFPAFDGDVPQVAETTMGHNLSRLASAYRDGAFVYDMAMSQDGSQAAVVSKHWQESVLDEVQFYENPLIVLVTLNNDRLADGRISYLYNGKSNFNDRITSGMEPTGDTQLCSLQGETESYAYLGSFDMSTDSINHVFIRKKYSPEGTTLMGKARVVKTMDCLFKGMVECDIGSSGASSPEACFAKYTEGSATRLKFAFLSADPLGDDSTTRYGSSTNLSSNTIGPTIDNVFESEMNSHDIHLQDVVVRDVEVHDGYMLPVGGPEKFNINADESYIPLYPGASGEISVLDEPEHACIELLGPSNDLTRLSSLVNTEVNPYFNLGMLSSEVYGMVYEDYDPSDDRSLFEFSNGVINSRSTDLSQVEISGETAQCFVWKMDISDMRLDEDQLEGMNLAFLKRSTLGKNPYAICRMREMPPNTPLPVVYDDDFPSRNPVDGHGNFSVMGGFSQFSDINPNSNRIDGVDAVYLVYDPGRGLSVLFRVHPGAQETVQIPEDSLQVLMFNPHDLRMFDRYHFFDVYGMVSIFKGTFLNPFLPEHVDDIEMSANGGHWGIYYDRNREDAPQVSGDLVRFFRDLNSNMVDIRSVQLSDYQHLSDVYVLKPDGGLEFKYSEQDYFAAIETEGRQLPMLSWNYPKSMAMKVWEQVRMQMGSDVRWGYNRAADIYPLLSAGTFVFQMESPSAVADSIGTVAVMLDRDRTRSLVVSEGYLLSDDTGAMNYERYSADDPRIMDFSIFQEYDPALSTAVAEIIDQSRTTSQALDQLSVTTVLQDEPGGSVQGQQVAVELDSGNVDLGELMKIHVNYGKAPDGGIRLMFNYVNYLDTPFVAIRDGREYPEIVENSYLVLDPGQSGGLNIVAQVRYEEGGMLMGVRTVVLARYHVVNVSDDKPKFVATRAGGAVMNSYAEVRGSTAVKIAMDDTAIPHGQDQSIAYLGVYTTVRLEPGYRIAVRYDRNAVDLSPVTVYGGGFQADESMVKDGYLFFTAKRGTDMQIPVVVTRKHGSRATSMLEVTVGGIHLPDGTRVSHQTRNGFVELE